MIRAVLDADVLYPMPLRDTLLSAAEAYCFQPVWTRRILEEVTKNLVADQRMTAEQAEFFQQVLHQHFEDALVEGYELLIPTMKTHIKDRHVAAAAVHAGANLIVTRNFKDFFELPPEVVAETPDAFLLRLLASNAAGLKDALAAQSARLKKPPISVEGIVDRLEPVAPTFAAIWRRAKPS